jgi:uncharacterized membrane protein HdeD (DUF308 family)
VEEGLYRVFSRFFGYEVAHGQMDFGSAIILFLLISGVIAVFSYAIKEAQKGKPGCLITGLVAGVLLLVMLSSCQ